MMVAKGITINEQTEDEAFDDATAAGRGYAVAGGVAEAIVNAVHTIDPDWEIPVDRAETLTECRKMLTVAKAGKRNGYLLEGMGLSRRMCRRSGNHYPD